MKSRHGNHRVSKHILNVSFTFLKNYFIENQSFLYLDHLLLVWLPSRCHIDLPCLLVICLLLLSQCHHFGVYRSTSGGLHAEYELAILHQCLILGAKLRQLTQHQLTLVDILDVFIH